jgi:hypothetical protein
LRQIDAVSSSFHQSEFFRAVQSVSFLLIGRSVDAQLNA